MPKIGPRWKADSARLNYTFGDFIKIGVPFSLVVMAVCVFMVPLLLPP